MTWAAIAVFVFGFVLLDLWARNMRLAAELERERQLHAAELVWRAARQARIQEWSEEQFFEVCLSCFHASKTVDLPEKT